MYKLVFVAILLPLLAASRNVNESEFPTFEDDYSISAILFLPYAEIREPFTGYYDISNNRSRVDYYGDLVITIQRPDIEADDGGVNYKVAYSVDKDGNPVRGCFKSNGSKESPVTPQSVLPDLSTFSYSGEEDCPNSFGEQVQTGKCELWEYVLTVGQKKNKYSFWLKRDANNNTIPVHYMMKGYDSLLGSHYDEYEISYRSYMPGPQSGELFDISSNFTCHGFPGPGVEDYTIHNPIKEFLHTFTDRIDAEFEKFKQKHRKSYDDKIHHESRKNIFLHNYRYIQSKNRANIHYELGVNHLTDLNNDELSVLRGRLHSKGYNGGQPFTTTLALPKLAKLVSNGTETLKNVSSLPDQWDWRLLGAVNPVKDQAVCGSCWSFGTTGTIEGVYFVKTGNLVDLSEQQLVDCSWNEQNNGCDGGEDFRAYKYIKKVGGLATDEDYGHYIGQDGKCHDKNVRKTVQLKGFVNVTSNNPQALELAIFAHGPVTVGIDASHKTLSYYANGVYYEPNCGNKPENLDHQVLAVGYGTLFGQKYWLIKNSWSTHWGNDGYILMSQKDNNCGVMTSPTFPLIA